MINIFEAILNDSKRFQFFKDDPFRFATFMACYKHVQQGKKLSDIGCFASIIKGEKTVDIKKAV